MRKLILMVVLIAMSAGVASAALVDNGDGTVTDTVTDLMWQKATAPGTYTWQAALDYAESLTLAGETDWRLPDINELQTLVDDSTHSPSVYPLLRGETQSSAYWSATTSAYYPSHAWLVYFLYGRVGDINKSDSYYVRAVRAGQSDIGSFGSLVISIEPAEARAAGAQWRRTGATPWYNNDDTENDVPAGTHTVEYKPVAGWTAPASRNVTITAGQTTRETGTYTPDDRLFKAILVAGTGPRDGYNILWPATEMNVNTAYLALTRQGYTGNTIFYLSHNTDVRDESGNLIVDRKATNANLEYAIRTWAQGADDLLIYMVGHGGLKTFRMGEFEVLAAADLNAWLNDFQDTGAEVVFLYDACRSGSFITGLQPPQGQKRIVIASATRDQPAWFLNDGISSFSYIFWTSFLRGAPFFDAWVWAKNDMVIVAQGIGQDAQLDANGDGIPNEKADLEIANAYRLGNGNKIASDIPAISYISPHQELTSGSSALIFAEGVTSEEGIRRVWAMITPPDYVVIPDQPILDIPVLEMVHTGGNRWEGTYRGFTRPGKYHISIFATDNSSTGLTSPPRSTSVTVIAAPVTSPALPGVLMLLLSDDE